MIQPFKIAIPDEQLNDLAHRLKAVRWPDEIDGSYWDYGTNLGFMKQFVSYWADNYDWRQREASLNTFPHFVTKIDGQIIHFIHMKGNGPNALPLIISHGWPGSFVEMREVIPLLTDPGAHGGDPADAFDVVVPSLPGFGFSGPVQERGMCPHRIGSLWGQLMERLGYSQFGAQGGDWGSAISLELALQHPDRLVGVHVNYIAGRILFGGALPDGPLRDKQGAAYVAKLKRWWDLNGGYNHQQSTRPQTLSFGLNDSPVGLAAWIIEKFRAWSDWDNDFEEVISRDHVIDNIMLYWLNNSVNSSLRIYHESRASPLALSASNFVKCPVGVSLFPKEIPMPPRSIAERGLNVVHWESQPKGGHFAAMEQPTLFAQDVRRFFKTLRRG